MIEVDQSDAQRDLPCYGMDAKTEAQLRQRVADYRRLGAMTWPEGVREAIVKVIAEAEERLAHSSNLAYTRAQG